MQVGFNFMQKIGLNDKLTCDDEYFNLWWLLILTRRAMHKAHQKELAAYSIKPEEAAILFALDTIGEDATMAEISRLTFRKPHSIAHILNKMEKKGIIKRSKDLPRRNLIRIQMTELGKAQFQIVQKTW